jgi:hypothetical protein
MNTACEIVLAVSYLFLNGMHQHRGNIVTGLPHRLFWGAFEVYSLYASHVLCDSVL